MPVALLRSFIDAMPRLEAEEMIKQGNVVAYGGANMKPEDLKSFSDDLRRQAGIVSKRKRASNQELRELFGGPPLPDPRKMKA